MNKIVTIYCLTFPNGKHYIGQTICSFKKRMSGHKSEVNKIKNKNNNRLLYNAIRKYGWNNIIKVDLGKVSIEDADKTERQFISIFRTNERKYGYNIEIGGNKYKKVSEETKKKISIANIGRKHSKETKEKFKYRNNGMLGRCHSDETKKKMSDAKKGKMSDEFKKRMSEVHKGNKTFYGKHHSEESKRKISESKKGYKHSDETKKKMSDAHKKRNSV